MSAIELLRRIVESETVTEMRFVIYGLKASAAQNSRNSMVCSSMAVRVGHSHARTSASCAKSACSEPPRLSVP